MNLNFIPIALVWFLCVPIAAQTTWYVDDDACPGPGSGTVGDPYCSIQDAIVASADCDTVVVEQGTYLEAINFLGKAITVRSSNPDDAGVVLNTIIDGTGFNHAVQCVSGEGPNTVLSGFVITGGNANGPLFVGGGMYNLNSSPTVTNCSFSGNNANNSGGGMYNLNSSPSVTNCMFSGNTARSGGGMYISSGSNPTVISCTFSGNSAIGNGGGILNNYNLTVINCTFSGNTAIGFGGGMFHNGISLTVTNSGFCNNIPDQFNGFAFTDGGGNSLLFCPPPIPLPQSCPADFDHNGNVNVSDLLELLAAWGPCATLCAPFCTQDIDGSGDVNVTDLLALLVAWGACP